MDTSANLRTLSVPALERGLHILEHLAQSRRGVSLTELTRKLQLPRSTGHALLLTYQRCGYVQRDRQTGRYRLGSRLQLIANTALRGHSLRDHCFSFLHRLVRETGLTAHLAVMEEGEVILIDRLDPPGEPKLATWVGKRMGLHCTAVGKALIAHLPSAKLDDLIVKQGLIRHNENTIASIRNLRQACERVKQLGYAIDDEEEEVGIRCIGAPVQMGDGGVVAAISISGTRAQIDDILTLAGIVRNCALLLSQHLGEVLQPEVSDVTDMSSDLVA